MIRTITVKKKPGKNRSHGLLQFGQRVIECRLGRSGIKSLKREGDGSTPIGDFKVLNGYYRSDRLNKPITLLKLKSASHNDGWCDDVSSPNYNQPIKMPFQASHEEMIRKDRLYDICLILDYNMFPSVRNRGSAIFFHLTSKGKKPTEGCVAIDPEQMRKLLPMLSKQVKVKVLI